MRLRAEICIKKYELPMKTPGEVLLESSVFEGRL